MFLAVCPHCRKTYKLDDSLIGKRATCKQCRNIFTLVEISDTTVQTDSAFDLKRPLNGCPAHPAPAAQTVKTKEPFAPETGLWNIGDLVLGIYEVKPLAENVPYAEGGVGIVHRIYHREWDMDLAVKSPKPQFFQTEHGKKSYEKEAQTWIELGLHPNIVTCYLVRRIGGIPRLFAEFVPDGSLRDWILNGRLYEGGQDTALLRIFNLAVQFAWGLEHAHRQTLLHLDVKPANVMMSGQTAKVADFGLSQAPMDSGTESSGSPNNPANMISIGMTPGYCSPEQYLAVELVKKLEFDKVPPLTVRTDIWSWAVSILSMFVGGPPCNKQGGQNARQVCIDFLKQKNGTAGRRMPSALEPPPMPKDVADLLLRCLEEEPAKRPESMEQIADELIRTYKSLTDSDFPRSKPASAAWTPDSMNNRAASFLDLNKPAEAVKLYDQAISMQPWHPAVTYNRTIIAWRLGQMTDTAAVERLETLIKMRPNNSGAVYGLGLAQRERGNLSSALDAFQNALSIEDREDIRRAISVTENVAAGDARCVESWTLLPDFNEGLTPSAHVSASAHSIYADSKSEFLLFYAKPQTLQIVSAMTGHIQRSFKIPQQKAGHADVHTETFHTERWALSDDLLWELYADPNGITMRRVGTTAAAYLFQKIQWSAAGNTSAAVGKIIENRVDISNLKTKRKIGSLQGHEGRITALAFCPDARFAATAAEDRTVRIWELPSCRCLRTFTTAKNTIDAVYFDPNKLFVLTLAANGTLRLWSVASLCRQPFRAPLQLSNVTSAEEAGRQQSEMERFCNDIRQAVRQKDYAAVLELWEKAKTLPGWETMRNILETEGIGDEIKRHTVRESFDSALCTHTLSGHSEPVTGIAVSLDANLIASAGQDTTIRIWNIAEQRREADLTGHRDWVRSIALTTDARFLVSGSWDGSVRIWNIAEKKTIRTFGERIKLLTKIALSPQGNIVAVANAAGSVLLWDVLSNTVLNRYTNRSSVNAVRFSRCGRYLVSGGDDGSVTIYHLPRKADGTRSPLNDRTFHDHQYPITAVAISTDRRTLFSADANGHIIVRKLQNNSAQEQGTFTSPSQTHGIQAHIGEITALELSADGRFLFSSAKEPVIKVWRQSAASGTQKPAADHWQLASQIEGHPAPVTSMVLEISGRRLITGSADGVVRAWELLWNYRFPGWQTVSEEAESVLRSLLSFYFSDETEQPAVDEDVMNKIMLEMGYCGFGMIPSEYIRKTVGNILSEGQERR